MITFASNIMPTLGALLAVLALILLAGRLAKMTDIARILPRSPQT